MVLINCILSQGLLFLGRLNFMKIALYVLYVATPAFCFDENTLNKGFGTYNPKLSIFGTYIPKQTYI
jgi:hypothetical protein